MTPERPAVYVNAASHGLPDAATVDRMIDHLRTELCDGAAAANAVAHELRAGHEAIARLIGAEAHTVGLHATTTSAWLEILSRVACRPGRVLVAAHEWGDHVRALDRLARCAHLTVELLPPLQDGRLDVGAWAERIDEDVLAVCVPMVTSVDGLAYPIEAIGALDRPDDTLLVVDAAQALGRVPIDIDRLGCDALVATGRKWLRGPRQLSMFHLSERFTRVTGSAAADLQPADVNVAVRLGLGIAAHALLRRGATQVSQDLRRRSDGLRTALIELGYDVAEPDAPGTVTLPLGEVRVERAAAALDAAGIVAKRVDASHVEPLAAREPVQSRVLRLSPHVYNPDSDIDRIVSIFKAI